MHEEHGESPPSHHGSPEVHGKQRRSHAIVHHEHENRCSCDYVKSSMLEPVKDEHLYEGVREELRFTDVACIASYVLQDWDFEEQPEVPSSPFELFFDLIFVAATIFFTANMAKVYPSTEFNVSFLAFSLCLTQWQKTVDFTSRFGFIGRAAQNMTYFFWAVYISAVFCTAANSEKFTKKGKFTTILVCTLIADIWAMLAYVGVSQIPRAKQYAKAVLLTEYVPHVLVTMLFLWVTYDVKVDYETVISFYVLHWLWYQFGKYLCLLIARSRMGTKFQYHVTIPVNVEKYADRFGELFLILIGENFITIIGEDLLWDEAETYLIVITFCFILVILNILYFVYQTHDPEKHAYRRNMTTSFMYNFGHNIAFIGILGFGIGQKIGLKNYVKAMSIDKDKHVLKLKTARLLSWSLFIIFVGLLMQWMASQWLGFSTSTKGCAFSKHGCKAQGKAFFYWLGAIPIAAIPFFSYDSLSLFEANFIYLCAASYAFIASKFVKCRDLKHYEAIMPHEHGHGCDDTHEHLPDMMHPVKSMELKGLVGLGGLHIKSSANLQFSEGNPMTMTTSNKLNTMWAEESSYLYSNSFGSHDLTPQQSHVLEAPAPANAASITVDQDQRLPPSASSEDFEVTRQWKRTPISLA